MVEHPPGDGQDRDALSDLQSAALVRCCDRAVRR
jgi:hypothetical protein